MAIESFVFVGKADAFIDVLTDAGVSTGYAIKGECTSCELKADSEMKEMLGRGRDTDGQTIASVVRAKPTAAKFVFKKVDAELFAMALAGTSATLSQANATITDQAVTAISGRYVNLGKINLSDTGFEVTNDGDTVTYVEGTDYVVNRRLGMLMAVSGGAITNGQALKVSYTHQLTTGARIVGAKRFSMRAAIKLDGQNLVDGRDFILDVPMVRLKTDTAVDFMKDDFMELSLSGTVEMATGQTEPFVLSIIE